MDAMVKKYQQKFKRVKDDMDQWDDIQDRLISQFRNASSIIGGLQLLEELKNYGSLKNIENIKDAILTKQMESLQTIMQSMNKTFVCGWPYLFGHVSWIDLPILPPSLRNILDKMINSQRLAEELNSVVLSLAKTLRDAKQQVKGGSIQASVKQLTNRIGIKPSLADCLEGLRLLHEMYQSEYQLNSSVISALHTLYLKPSVKDLHDLEQLLVDQPNIQREEVQSIYDIIYAKEIC